MADQTIEPGTLLVAHPELKDPIFGKSVILVLAAGEGQGTIGVNLAAQVKGRLFDGGPCDSPAPILLHEAKEGTAESRPVGATGYAITGIFPGGATASCRTSRPQMCRTCRRRGCFTRTIRTGWRSLRS